MTVRAAIRIKFIEAITNVFFVLFPRKKNIYYNVEWKALYNKFKL